MIECNSQWRDINQRHNNGQFKRHAQQKRGIAKPPLLSVVSFEGAAGKNISNLRHHYTGMEHGLSCALHNISVKGEEMRPWDGF